jgi:hypothetical protein
MVTFARNRRFSASATTALANRGEIRPSWCRFPTEQMSKRAQSVHER